MALGSAQTMSVVVGSLLVFHAFPAHSAHLWAVGSNSKLYEVDTTAMTVAESDPPVFIPGLLAVATVHPGDVYLLTTGQQLYRYHRGEGATLLATLQGQIGATGFGSGEDGYLYAGSSAFYRIDLSVLEADLLSTGPYSFDGDLAADSSGSLFGAASGNLVQVNKASGALTTIGPLAFAGHGLAFSRDGRLYGAGGGSTLLYEVDPLTGALIGPSVFDMGITVADLASAFTCGNGVIDADEGEVCDDTNGTNGDGCDSNCQVTACGNGILTSGTGEQCDDGNVANGDCCSSTCQFEAAASNCNNGDACDGEADTCNASGVCAGTPIDCADSNACTQDGCHRLTGCFHDEEPYPFCDGPLSKSLSIRDDPDDSKDTLKWKWAKGIGIYKESLGDPVSETSYTLCIYDESAGVPHLATSLSLTPNALWEDKGAGGWKYDDKLSTTAGIRKLQLKPNKANQVDKAKASLTAKGIALPLPLPADVSHIFDMDPRVTVQLVNTDGKCMSSQFTDAKTDRGDKFSAK